MKPIISQNIWKQLEYFSPNENWGDPNKMDVRLLWNLDSIRGELNRGININCGYSLTGHAEKSFHKVGMAVDFYITNTSELWDLYCFFLSNWYGGVGVYPYWDKPGLHLDIGPDRTWVRDKNGKYFSDSAVIKSTIEQAHT